MAGANKTGSQSVVAGCGLRAHSLARYATVPPVTITREDAEFGTVSMCRLAKEVQPDIIFRDGLCSVAGRADNLEVRV